MAMRATKDDENLVGSGILASGSPLGAGFRQASARRAATVTRAPRVARKTAKKRPRPLDPPVTSTCDPSIANGSFIENLSQAGGVASGHLVPDKN